MATMLFCQRLFRDVFQCRGRDCGSPSRGVLGISDGNEGVQWNAGYYPRDGAVWLGVNLEGMKYDSWPVARLIEREISRPLLGPGIARRSQNPTGSPYSGRATRGSIPPGAQSRRPISPPRRSRWIASMARAGRMRCEARGNVWTPEATSRPQEGPGHAASFEAVSVGTTQVEMDVSPRLKIGTQLAEITSRAMREGRGELEALWEFVAERSGAYRHRGGYSAR